MSYVLCLMSNFSLLASRFPVIPPIQPPQLSRLLIFRYQLLDQFRPGCESLDDDIRCKEKLLREGIEAVIVSEAAEVSVVVVAVSECRITLFDESIAL